jgi:ribosome-associated toxin RatA of RatAB toxin-antitoxin module
MPEIKLSTELRAPAERVWEIVGNFNGLPDWHPWVKASVLEPAAGGIGRRVTIDGGTAGLRELVERLVSYNASERSYEYTVMAGPKTPFHNYIGLFRISANGPNSCVFDYHGQFDVAPGATESDAVDRVRTFYGAAKENLRLLFGSNSS